MKSTTYQEADAYLGAKQDRPVPGHKRTRIQRRANGAIAIRQWQTDVVTYQPDGTITLRTGGWPTVTTRRHWNAHQTSVVVYQHRWEWYVCQPGAWQQAEQVGETLTILPNGDYLVPGRHPKVA